MKSKLSMILFVLILGSSLTLALVTVDNVTREPIARNKVKKLRMSILSSLGLSYTPDNVEEAFSENVITKNIAGIDFYQSKDGGEMAFEFNGMGLWGPISGTIALTPDLQKIYGISIIHQEETPGLGSRIADPEFLDQLKGKNITNGLLVLPAGKKLADNEVHGITGATLSCKALEGILNAEIKKNVSMIEEGKK